MINIVCPAHTATGGTEALHQLGQALRVIGRQAQMVYFNSDGMHSPCAPRFEKYGVPYIEGFQGEEEITVIPEIYIDSIPTLKKWFPKTKICVWWLSVDNARMNDDSWKTADVVHLAQSMYAEDFLKSNGIEPLWVSDYINDDFFEPVGIRKEDIVIFNPVKGFENICDCIRNSDGRIKWVALNNMTPRELRDAMYQAKVYIDLGHCPGKDRMPREALLCGCNVITSTLGGFGNDVDIPIPNKYKVNTTDEALHLIYELMGNYSEHAKEFEQARMQITSEKDKFLEDVRNAFAIKHPNDFRYNY